MAKIGIVLISFLAALQAGEAYLLSPEFSENQAVLVVDQQLIEVKSISGRLLSQSAQTMILQTDDGRLVTPSGAVSLLKPIDQTTIIVSHQPGMTHPFLQSHQKLYVFSADAWRMFPVSAELEYSGPDTALTSAHRFELKLPFLFDMNDAQRVLSYHPQTGRAAFMDSKGEPQVSQLGRRAHPIRLNNLILWLNLPEEGDCQISTLNQPLRLNDAEKIPHLNRYPLILSHMKKAWVVTFPFNVKRSLRSWEDGTTEITLNCISADGDKIQVQSFSQEHAPLSFQLGVSSSGSPRLDVKPRFRFLPVANEDKVCLVFPGELIFFSPDGPTGYRVTADSRHFEDLAVIQQDLKVGWNSAGKLVKW